MGNITGAQDGFSFKSLATSVISAGITQGLSSALKLDAVAAGFNWQTAARAGLGSLVNQGLNVITGQQQKFDWKGVAAAALAAPVAAGISNHISGAADFEGSKASVKPASSIDFGSRLAGGLVGGLAATVVRQAVYGGGKMNFSQVAADAFGNAVGQALLPGVATQTSDSSGKSEWRLISGDASAIDKSFTTGATWAGDANARHVVILGGEGADPEADYYAQLNEKKYLAERSGSSDEMSVRDREDAEFGGRSLGSPHAMDAERTLSQMKGIAETVPVMRKQMAEAQAMNDVRAAQDASAQDQREFNRAASIVESGARSRGATGSILNAAALPTDADPYQGMFSLTMTEQERNRPDAVSTWKNGLLTSIVESGARSRISSVYSLAYGVADLLPGSSSELVLAGGGAVAGVLGRAGRILDSVEIAKSGAATGFAFDALNPGPLPNRVAGTFAGGRYNERVGGESGLVLYKAGDKTNPGGSFFTFDPPNSVAQSRIDSAVRPQWFDSKTGALIAESPINSSIVATFPPGTKYYVGPVSSQGGVYVGGMDKLQIYVPNARTSGTFTVLGPLK